MSQTDVFFGHVLPQNQDFNLQHLMKGEVMEILGQASSTLKPCIFPPTTLATILIPIKVPCKMDVFMFPLGDEGFPNVQTKAVWDRLSFCFVITMGGYICSNFLCMYLIEIKREVAPP